MIYNDERLDFRAQLGNWNKRIEIAIFGKGLVVEPFVVRDIKEEEKYIVVEPNAVLTLEQSQTLMDDLWNCGIRPSEGAGSAGAMRAVENHLKDMRKIAGNQLGIEL